MRIQELSDTLKDYARDVRLNLSSVLTEEGAPGLTKHQIWGVALSSAYYTKSPQLIDAIQGDASEVLPPEYVEAAKAASTIMAMNNVYYRFTHLSENKEFSKMPARLRMNVIGKPGIAKIDFEILSMAVSALSGCGACINAHAHELQKVGFSQEGAQSAVRIAAVINSAAQALAIG